MKPTQQTSETRHRHPRAAALLAASCIAASMVFATAAQAQTTVTVAKVAQDFAFMMADYGKELGIFKKHGVDVNVTQITQAKMVQAAVSGSVEMALASGATLAYAAKGAPLRGVAALSGPPTILVLIVRPDNSVPNVDALKGKTVAVTNFGSLTDWAVSQVATSKGWNPAEIKRVSVGDTPSRVAALKTGAADAAVLDIAAALDLEERGEAKILVQFGQLIKNFQNQLIYATEKTIKEKPDGVRNFLKGWFETIAYARTHKPETVAYGMKAIGIKESVANKAYDILITSDFLSTDGKVNTVALGAMSKNFVELKLLPKEEDLSKFITAEFLPK